MHLITISGFLGAGKTTLILNLAEAITARGVRVAILVNEIGIDDQFMEANDLNVRQLLNGCICCSLDPTSHIPTLAPHLPHIWRLALFIFS
ncbi:MAG: hypothetical protein JRH15_12915 [Deltaproteobacteria bacterium]|nr:hypothetical protein [Deltaproteobacteria bacterium]